MTPPCTWPLDYCSAPASEAWSALDDEQKAVYETAATEYLWRWTGRSLGICEVTVRPCRSDCLEGVSTFNGGSGSTDYGSRMWSPVLLNGEWFNVGCGYCGDKCGCDVASSIRLPGPVVSVTSVQIDGEVVDPAAYRVDNRRNLVRQDGGTWPTCQALSSPDGEPGTWSVTYEQGTAVPVGGQIAAGVLAIELFKAACNDASCGLPRRVQTVTRQGVTIAMLDSFDDIDSGHTGIWIIDSWIASMSKPSRGSVVYSPDVTRPRRTTFGG